MVVSPAKTAEPIEIPFGLRTREGLSNYILDTGVQIQHAKGSVMSCAKTAEPIKMPFGAWTQVGAKKHVIDGNAHWHNLANTTESSTSNCFDHLFKIETY